jgi:hypothetical protein
MDTRHRLALKLCNQLQIAVAPEKIIRMLGGYYDYKLTIQAANNTDYTSAYNMTELLRAPMLEIKGRDVQIVEKREALDATDETA